MKLETGIDCVTAEIVGSVEVNNTERKILIRKNTEDKKSSCYLIDGSDEIEVSYKSSASDDELKAMAFEKADQLNNSNDLSAYF